MLIARYGDAGIGCGVIEIVFHGDVSFNECFGELTFRSSGQGVGAHARASATAEALLIEPSALNYYSRTLAVELAPSGIRVNVVSPGLISTPGSDEFSKANPGFSRADWLRNIPLGRIGDTEDIAEVVALLVSDRGKFLTGANYGVDGGMTAR
jgi:enoyl-[acyl-carrier-protein] reductase (NADH)